MLLLVVVVAIPLVGLSAWAGWSAHEGTRIRAEEALVGRARALALPVERDFDRAWTLLHALAGSPAFARGDLMAFEHEMRAASVATGGAPVTLVAADGTITFSTLWAPGERRSGIQAPDAARQIMAAGQGEVVNLFSAPLSGRLSVAVGMPIFAPGEGGAGRRDVLAAIGISMPREHISATLRSASGLLEEDARSGRVAAILDRNGISVARTGREQGIVGAPARPEMRERLSSLDEGILTDMTNLDGAAVVTAVTHGFRSGFTYILTIPKSEFMAPFRARLAQTLAFSSFILVAGLGLAALLARRTAADFRTALGSLENPSRQGTLREANELAQILADASEERRRAEAALRESEERFRLVAESAPVMLWMGDSNGKCIYLNRALREFWGVEQAAVPQFDWSSSVHPDDHASLFDPFRRAMETQSAFAVEARYRRVDGTYRVLHTDARPRFASSGDFLGMIGVNVDVTGPRQAAAALQESEARLRELLATLDLTAALVRDTSGIIRFWSAGCERLYGWTAEEANGRPANELLMSDFSSPAAEIEAELIRHGEWKGDARQRRRDGTEVIVAVHKALRRDPGGRPIAVAESFTDVTALRQAEAALRASEERLRLAQEAGGIGAWELDLATGMRYWSASTYRLWGVEPGTPITLDLITSMIHPEDRARTQAAVAEAARMTGPLPELEIRIFRRSDGALRWILSRAEAVTDMNGRAVRQIGIMRDITSRKEAMERQNLLMRELDHRAKNALAVVAAALRLTHSENPKDFVRSIEGRVAALARAHTMLARERWEGADFRTLIEGELAAFRAAGSSSGEAPGEPQIEIHGPALMLSPTAAQAFSMAFHELATNATKYGALAAPGGSIRITWSLDDAGRTLRLCWEERGGPRIAEPPSRRGFGSRVIEATIRTQLGGEVERNWKASGLACEMRVPMSRILASSTSAGPVVTRH